MVTMRIVISRMTMKMAIVIAITVIITMMMMMMMMMIMTIIMMTSIMMHITMNTDADPEYNEKRKYQSHLTHPTIYQNHAIPRSVQFNQIMSN